MKTKSILSNNLICVFTLVSLILSLSCTKDDFPSEDLKGIEIPEETGPNDQPKPEYRDDYIMQTHN